ncbi:unnamed protein product [Dimorphilus gyrociliatus]|uniref:Uncharacterized protein n=1 Tax=Dimorphilus gyrociliatus TaxID=2664684 RepID=A0A7I8W1M3_9ANNE|nr:unnamed protein product [Dimorphilus gyrociliatus]
MSTSKAKVLIAFDFDHTIVDENSEPFVFDKLAPNGIPDDIKSLYNRLGWNEYVGAVFAYLHSKGTSVDEIKKALYEVKLTAGMKQLLDLIKSEGLEAIIISDANSVFINELLKKFNLTETFSTVYTNPSKVEENGLITISYYHKQDWCDLSTVNMCKGHILDEHIKTNGGYDKVMYVGDGYNDLCPALRLRKSDVVCPRIGFSLKKSIENLAPPHELHARVVNWLDATELLQVTKSLTEKD